MNFDRFDLIRVNYSFPFMHFSLLFNEYLIRGFLRRRNCVTTWCQEIKKKYLKLDSRINFIFHVRLIKYITTWYSWFWLSQTLNLVYLWNNIFPVIFLRLWHNYEQHYCLLMTHLKIFHVLFLQKREQNKNYFHFKSFAFSRNKKFKTTVLE